MSIPEKTLTICDFGSSTFSLVSIPTNTTFPSCCHWLICIIRSPMNCLWGLGFGVPVWSRSHVCWAVMVLEVASNS